MSIRGGGENSIALLVAESCVVVPPSKSSRSMDVVVGGAEEATAGGCEGKVAATVGVELSKLLKSPSRSSAADVTTDGGVGIEVAGIAAVDGGGGCDDSALAESVTNVGTEAFTTAAMVGVTVNGAVGFGE